MMLLKNVIYQSLNYAIDINYIVYNQHLYILRMLQVEY